MPKIDKNAKGEAARIRAKATVKALLKHQGNQTKAAKELGISKHTMRDRITKNPFCREELHKAYKRKDVSLNRYAKAIREGLDAERTVSVEDNTEGSKPGDRTQITEPDHAIRLRSAEIFIKTVGLASPHADENSAAINLGGNHIHLHLGDKSDNDLVEDIRSQLAFFRNGQSASPS